MNRPNPPHIATKFLQFYCKSGLIESIQGDLEEQFDEDLEAHGRDKARRRYTWNVIRFFRPGIIKSFGTQKLNNYGMYRNYIITALRFIKREKLYALMNIAGLALGIGCALLIYKMIDMELSYDKHHENFDNLYRVINEDTRPEGKVYWMGQIHPLAGALRNDFTGLNAAMTFYDKDAQINVEDENGQIRRFQEKEGVAFVEPRFLELFTLKFLQGDAKYALDQPGKVILTESLAKKFFDASGEDLNAVIGRPLVLENEATVYVSAVVTDPPTTTEFPFTILFHYQDQDAANPWFRNGTDWDEYNSDTNCFVMLDEGVDPDVLETRLEAFVQKYLPEHAAKTRKYRLQPLADIHSSEQIDRNYGGETVSKDKLLAIGLVGLFLIITACINFINLSTAQAVKRSKEVGVRKSLGSSRRQLVMQFLTETFMITLLATALGALIAQLLSTQVAHVFGYAIGLNFSSDVSIWIFLTVLVVSVAFVSGIYPAFILAKMNPILAVKNSLNSKQTSGFLSLRRSLVVFQFVISQILIIGTLVVNSQMDYFLTKDLGFNTDSVIMVKLPERDSVKMALLKNTLVSHSKIEKVSFSTSGPMADWKTYNPIFHPEFTDDQWGNLKNVDENYFDLYEMEFVAGAGFKAGDPRDYVVVNRHLTELMGFENPNEAIGKPIKYGRGTLNFTIVGVVEDFHSESLHGEIENVFLANLPWNIFHAGIKIQAGQAGYTELKGTIEFIESAWTEAFPNHVFDFEFYDEQLALLYVNEQKTADVFQLFVVIALIIGCLGLYGLISFMSNQKTKEIGIRKVMGATVFSIWSIFSREMMVLLGIAFLIAVPAGWYAMNSWLENYEYRIDLNAGIFLVSILISVIIAFITISYKSIQASRANPVLSLRDE